MPYVITTNQGRAFGRSPIRVLSRRAVATLDEAQKEAAKGQQGLVRASIAAEFSRFPEQGGTINLPDGTEIEVSPADWAYVSRAAGFFPHPDPSDETQTQILSAFNTSQGDESG